MRSITPLLAASASLLTTGASAAFAQEQETIITACDADGQSDCLLQNRVCYKYAANDTQSCGYCILDYFEYESECIAIADVGTEGFLLLSRLLELYLPEYVDKSVSTAVRAARLMAATKVISQWNSQVPPPPFELGLTEETFLTEEERAGRLGVSSDITFEDGGFRGKMQRFAYSGGGNNDEGDDGDAEDGGDGRTRRLTATRKLDEFDDQPPPPPSVDWEATGYTTVVKNQGLCGCCWAVSTAAAVESALMITNQTSRYDSDDRNSLSFQQMISCDDKEMGCGGGNILQATRYVWEHDNFKNGNFGGLVSAADWPYNDFLGQTTTECQSNGKGPSEFTPVAYLNFPKIVNSVNDRSNFEERRDRMMAAIAIQPAVSVLRAGCELFMNYKGGVLTHDSGCECDSTSCIDHAIVVTGYDTTAPTPYWKLRNSYGSGWGEEGYFRIAMNDRGIGEWGLFGMLAEAAIPSQAVQNLEDLPERPGWWERAATWEKVMVVLFSILGFCCLCGCLGALWNRRK